HRPARGHGLDRLADAVQQFDRMAQGVAADVHHLLQVAGGDAGIGQLDGGLDHRQGHALYAVAEHLEVAALDLEQVAQGACVVQVDVAADDLLVALLRGTVVVLAAPQGVVAVEADQADVLHGRSCARAPSRRACRIARAGPARKREAGRSPLPWSLPWSSLAEAVTAWRCRPAAGSG